MHTIQNTVNNTNIYFVFKNKEIEKKEEEDFILHSSIFTLTWGVVGWCEGAVYLTSLGRPTDIGLQLGKACYPCSG